MGSCAACIYGFKPHLHPLFIFSLLAFLLRHASMGDFNIHDADGSASWRCFPDTHLHISLPVISLSLTHLPLCVCWPTWMCRCGGGGKCGKPRSLFLLLLLLLFPTVFCFYYADRSNRTSYESASWCVNSHTLFGLFFLFYICMQLPLCTRVVWVLSFDGNTAPLSESKDKSAKLQGIRSKKRGNYIS